MGTGRAASARWLWGCRLALGVGVGAHALWLLAWVAADGRVAPQVCCDLSDPVVDVMLMSAEARANGWPWTVLNRGAMSWAAWAMIATTGGHIDALLWVQVVALSLSQGALFWLLRPLHGPLAALLAALLLPAVPGVAFASRQWDPYTLQGLVLLLAAGALVRSRSLTRPGWSVLVGALGWLGAVMSQLLTDDLLSLLSWGSLGAVAALRGLVWGRDAWGARIARWRVPLGGGLALLTCLAGLYAAAEYRGDLDQHLRYYGAELGLQAPSPGTGAAPVYTRLADARSPEALTAYARRLGEVEVGPLLALAVLGGCLVLLLRRRSPGRAELLVGLLGPPILLSMVAKKQAFYVYLCLPFVPAVLMAALLGCSGRPTPTRSVLAALVVVLVSAHTLRDSLSARHIRPAARWQAAVLQLPYPLVLFPQAGAVRMPFGEVLDRFPQDCSAGPQVVAVLGRQEGSALGEPDLGARLQWRLAAAGRCVDVYPQLARDRPPPAAVLLALGADCLPSEAIPGIREWQDLQARGTWLLADEHHTARGDCEQVWVLDPALADRLRAAAAP